MNRLIFLILIGITSIVAANAVAQDAILDNGRLKILCEEHSSYSLARLENIITGTSFIEGEAIPIWELVWRSSDGRELSVSSDTEAKKSARIEQDESGQVIYLTWSDIEVGDGTAEVVVTAKLEMESELSEWSLRVEWTDEAILLWQTEFPRIGGISKISDDDVLTIPRFWGACVKNPIERLRSFSLAYPCPASMQFWAYVGGGAGLYLASHDSAGWMKKWRWSAVKNEGTGEWRAIHFPPNPPSLSRRYELPYPMVIGTFSGDWNEAAALYRNWALRQPWCREGRIYERRSVPEWLKNVAIWLKYYGEPGKVLGELWDHQQYLHVPMAVHYYRYSISKFDDNYPEFLPAKSGFIQGVRDMQQLGAHVVPYTQGSIWDMDTESWRREGGEEAAAKDEDGGLYEWSIRENTFAWMCPFARTWQEKVFDFTRKLVWDYGVDGVYLDVLSAGGVRPCYDASHGHTIHGGTYWGQGNRQLIESLRQRIRAEKPGAIFTAEEICEIYLDKLDAFLTLDVTRGKYRPPLEFLPLFTAVYHDYAIQYGSDCALSMDTDLFCALLAEHFISGSMLTLSEQKPPEINDKPESAAYLRELARCYDSVGRKFLLYGQWQHAPTMSVPGRMIHYVGKKSVDMEMPVVKHSLWLSPDGSLGLVLTNWTGQSQRVNFAFAPTDYGMQGELYWHRLWPYEHEKSRSIGEEVNFDIELPPRSVRLYELSSNPYVTEPACNYAEQQRFIFLKRNREGRFEKFHVEPGTIWYGKDTELVIESDGELSVRTLKRCGNYVLLKRHPSRLEKPVRMEINSFGNESLSIAIKAPERIILENVEDYQVVARTAAGDLRVIRQNSGVVISPNRTAVTIWLTKIDGSDDSTAAQLGASLSIETEPCARAVPYDPLPLELKLKCTSHKSLTWENPRVEILGNLHRKMVKLDQKEIQQSGSIGGFSKSLSLGKYHLLVFDRDLSEHAITLRASVTLIHQDRKENLVDELTIPVDMPLLVDLLQRKGVVAAGKAIEIELKIRNVTRKPLNTTISLEQPKAWRVEPASVLQSTIPAAGNQPGYETVRFILKAPVYAEAGLVSVPLRIIYNDHDKAAVMNTFVCNVIPSLHPLFDNAEPFEVVETALRMRGDGRALLYLLTGETAEITISNKQVATYTDETHYSVKDPNSRQIEQGRVNLNQAKKVIIRAEKTGTYLIEWSTGSGSSTIETSSPFLVMEASSEKALSLIRQNVTLYFYVPKLAKSFSLILRSGGKKEPVNVKVIDNTGRAIVEGQVKGAEVRRFDITPAPGTRGEVWQMNVRPKEDVSLYMEGDVPAYVADHPSRLLMAD